MCWDFSANILTIPFPNPVSGPLDPLFVLCVKSSSAQPSCPEIMLGRWGEGETEGRNTGVAPATRAWMREGRRRYPTSGLQRTWKLSNQNAPSAYFVRPRPPPPRPTFWVSTLRSENFVAVRQKLSKPPPSEGGHTRPDLPSWGDTHPATPPGVQLQKKLLVPN